MKGQARTPAAELRIAFVAAAVSRALGVIGAAAVAVLRAAEACDLVVAAFGWLARINLVLAVFNLVLAAPLSTGRCSRR